jgi:hypothetical protein
MIEGREWRLGHREGYRGLADPARSDVVSKRWGGNCSTKRLGRASRVGAVRRKAAFVLSCQCSLARVGRVEVWRGGFRSKISVAAPFVWRCLTGSTLAPFPHPPGHRRRSLAPGSHRTWRADFPHRRCKRNIEMTASAR